MKKDKTPTACHLLLAACLFLVNTGAAENGHRLWLRADTSAQATVITSHIGATAVIAANELRKQWQGSPVILSVKNTLSIKDYGNEGFIINENSQKEISITAGSEAGLLYGAYHLLRLQAIGAAIGTLNISEAPKYKIRLLNHWDNLDGTIERGYAGYSIWKWDELPQTISPRYKEYARANASIGINGTVLNNVNATPQVLTSEMLQKVKIIAEVLRPYNIKVYLSINFSSPMALGGLNTADPLDKDVRQWWKNKVKEIYQLIPDFGGFLVKANSEGLPGPQDFGRTHLDGANMLAEALAPHKGIVMWRAFVYHPTDTDRAKQAYQEFTPFDGKFLPNVLIQVKNGPIDFQPREPFSPLFGAMQQTPVMSEFQITQEYLGFSNHLAYLGTMYKECLDSDTYAHGEGSSVAKATDGSLFGHKISAIAGVANIGEDTNWCGHHLAQANWYAFGRLAWNHTLSAESISREWIRQTFTDNEEFITPVAEMMMQSREAVVNYMMPMGLHHLFAWGHHYGPEPWCEVEGARPDWLPSYYHKADHTGIGFNRSSTGSNAVAQYFSPLREEFNHIQSCDERYLLWFHHVAWDYRMKSGRTLWDELCYHYDKGVQSVRKFQKIWDSMEPYIDAERFAHVQARLRIQARDAVWWKDACLLYFQIFSMRHIPYELERPVHDLDDLKKIKLNMTHHN
ncbi:MAG: alpha-glucuronidase [Bacteroidales bacterium]|nr:alpha-glucuronidase [Bacteroidales bacterium]MCL2133312.1 alpha-glucuronidase [Bacteroidales bacterium]